MLFCLYATLYAVQNAALQAEPQELLEKQAISRVPLGQENEGFYSHYFLVRKKTGTMGPILDLSLFNRAIIERPFCMLTVKQVFKWYARGDWLTSIDLKEMYFHVPVIPEHRNFLRFSFWGSQYQDNWLPFGYSLSPRTISKCWDGTGAVAVGGHQGPVLSGLPAAIGAHLSHLGFTVNWKKNAPLPSPPRGSPIWEW